MSAFMLFFASLILVVSSDQYPCCSSRCTCDSLISTALCDQRNLDHVPVCDVSEVLDIDSGFFADNDIRVIKPEDFSKNIWISLTYIDLTENKNLNCESLDNIPESITVISDCPTGVATVMSTNFDVENFTVTHSDEFGNVTFSTEAKDTMSSVITDWSNTSFGPMTSSTTNTQMTEITSEIFTTSDLLYDTQTDLVVTSESGNGRDSSDIGLMFRLKFLLPLSFCLVILIVGVGFYLLKVKTRKVKVNQGVFTPEPIELTNVVYNPIYNPSDDKYAVNPYEILVEDITG